jgi:hypothetical protein
MILGLVLSGSCAHADEPDHRTPLDQYRGITKFALTLCSAAASLETQAQVEECVTTTKQDAVTKFKAAILTVKKDKAQEALKTYHVAFISAIEGIAPGFDEPRIIYQQRQQALAGKVTEAWSRFEIEE